MRSFFDLAPLVALVALKWVPPQKTSSLAAVTGGSFTLIVSVGSWQCELAHFAEIIQGYCHLMPLDKKLACLTNYQERRSFPWPLVLYKGLGFFVTGIIWNEQKLLLSA